MKRLMWMLAMPGRITSGSSVTRRIVPGSGTNRTGIVLAMVAFLVSAASAQVTLTVNILKPTPAQLSVWENNPAVVTLIITNPTGTSYPNARIGFVLSDEKDVQVAASKNGDPRIPTFTLPASQTVTRFGPDIVRLSAVDYDAQYASKVGFTKTLPEGEYTFCVQLLDQNGIEITSTGKKCDVFTVITPDPPTLTLPMEAAAILPNTLPQFTWTPVNLGGLLLPKYKLTIAPVYANQSAQNAIEQNIPVVSREVQTTSYLYTGADPDFSLSVGAVKFAWQVQALTQQGEPAARNDGKSEIATFTIGTPQQQLQPPPPQPPPPQPQVAQQTGPCNDECIVAAPANTTPAGALSAGEIIRVGKFTLTLTQASGTGANLTGAGTIQVPFLKAPVMVGFLNIKVNTNREVFDGKIEALQQQGSPITQAVANNSATQMLLPQQTIRDVASYASQGERLVSGFTGSTPIGLPIGFDKSIDGQKYIIAVMGMVFTPTQGSLNAVMLFDMPDLGPNVGIGLGATGICFHPGGISTAQGMLYLPSDVGYAQPQSFNFIFKGANLPSDSGTFVAWDCEGFKELRLKAEVRFPRDWLVPAPDNNQQVNARFMTSIRKRGDWIAGAMLDPCTFAGAPGFELVVKDMFYDHSDIQNPPGMIFPAAYMGTKGPDWHGFFLKTASVKFPQNMKTFKNERPSVAVTDFLIDGSGITGRALGTNLLQSPDMDLGGWGASVDTIDIQMVSSSLQKGNLAGRIGLPVSKDPLNYSALLFRPQGPQASLAFQFSIVPRSNINADFLLATLTIKQASNIQINNLNGQWKANAVLHGTLSIAGTEQQKVPLISFPQLDFQDVKVMSESPYFSAGTWKLGSPQKSVAGFGVKADSIRPVFRLNSKNGNPEFGLAFTLQVTLCGEKNGINGAARLGIFSTLEVGKKPMQFAFAGVELDSVGVKADIGAVKIEGSLKIYNSDATYGNGFRGQLKAQFAKIIEVQATAQFGSVNGFQYWYVDAMAILPPPGIPLGATGTALFGFGGGIYYNMTRDDPPIDLYGTAPNAPDDGTKAGITNSGVRYIPSNGVAFGFKAMITMGTVAPQMFSADVTFEMTFLQGGGVGMIAFGGDGYFISTGIENRKSALLLATVMIKLDFVKSTFDGHFEINTSKDLEWVVKLHAWMHLYISPQNWHLLIGTPKNRNEVSVLKLATFEAYFMAGTDIPAPDFNDLPHKKDIETAIGSPLPIVRMPFKNGPVSGFAFGANLHIDTGNQCFLVLCGRLMLGAGFDIAFLNIPEVSCEGREGQPIGVNGWYAMGQVYLYAYGSIYLDIGVAKVNIIEAGAGARAVIMAPDPTYLTGTVGGHFSALGGLIKGQFVFNFEVGDRCKVVVETPIAGLEWIEDFKPVDGESDVSVFAIPTASTLFPMDQPFTLQSLDSDGNPKLRTFQIALKEYTLVRSDTKAPVPGRRNISKDGIEVRYVADDAFEGEVPLTATIELEALEFVNGKWQTAYLKDGKTPARQTRQYSFKTGKRPDVIIPSQVLASYPIHRQKFFLQDEIRSGYLRVKQGYLFDPQLHPGKYFARFVPLDGGNSIESPITYNASTYAAEFAIPQLANSMRYAIQIIRSTPGSVAATVAFSKTASSAGSTGQTSMFSKNAAPVSSSSPNAPYAKSPSMGTPSAGSSGSGVGTFAIDVMARMLPGTEIRPFEFLLYYYYFSTSKHNTLAQKLASLTNRPTERTATDGIFESVTGVFSGDEAWDDAEVLGPDNRLATGDREATHPLITVTAHAPSELWYTSFVWPKVYDPIRNLMFAGLWSGQLADGFNLWVGLLNTGTTVEFAGPTSGKMDTPLTNMLEYVNSTSVKGMNTFIRANPEIRLRYLHPALVPGDYLQLWTRAAKVLWQIGDGTISLPSQSVYSMLWSLGTQDLSTRKPSYELMYSGTYTLNFIYGPKFTWEQSGAWIRKTFPYTAPYQNPTMKQSVVPTQGSSTGKTTTIIRRR